ncbi:type VI secretion system tip protein VgrG, partial [Salmonella enterica subsp. enterica serovar Mississippi]|nr:type VI secretion system tip protein VgrG [Salmonella enterica subsp. enterica serovar Mississippi]
RVKFRWDRYNPQDETSSCWVRVSQAWAIPRIGQEVIVDFLNGDPDQPVVMGRTYHEDNRSPGKLPGTKTQMTIRSKTYKGSGFNELRFEDATNKEQVYIHAQKDMDTEVLNNRTTKVKVDHTETIGNNQSITVVKGQTVSVGTKKEGGHDQTLKVTNDRMASISHDDGLYVKNDRKVTVEGKQEQSTTGDHISLVKGTHSLEVKGDLARKVSGALGIKVEGDIVLESSSQISLKAGASFIVIQAGGVDIVGPKINLNGGGSAGTPVRTMQPGGLAALTDDGGDEEGEDDGKGNGDSGGGDGGAGGGGGDDGAGDDDEDEPEKYTLQLHFTDDDGIPYSETRYIAFFEDGTERRGETDKEGNTEVFTTDSEQEIKVRLLHQSIDMIEGGVYE